ncbi:blastula protease 10-like [Pollicipes pollicipes]|uniref:blastula protease 10-like n=1 Tax=Pollicipes pollicipes TaxID=41117 RepID=UPI0018849B32|nr:blastula protease 10-like [Pollicipes pollicipes]
MKTSVVLALLALAAARPRSRQVDQQQQVVTDGPQEQVVTEGPKPEGLPLGPADDLFEYRNPETTDFGDMLFESDMVLTEEQRLNRQAASNLWTSPVSFAISSSSAGDRAAILAGIQHWRDHSCIEFDEVSEGSSTPHINFVKSSGCWSYIGQITSSGGQRISIGNGCTSLGTVAHEIGHAMGLNHQQSRPDRDTYVQINFENIKSGKEGNFRISSSSDNYSVPYDLTSVMHYGSTYFSSNGKDTIQVKNVLYEGLIGTRGGFSHRDKHIINAMYQCDDACSSKPTCLNGGFVGKDCTCVCPHNTEGANCESETEDYYGELACGDEDMTDEGTITSPNYPANFPRNVVCFWVITAPENQQVELSVTDMKMLYRYGGSCPWDYLTVRHSGDIHYDDVKACDAELTGQTFTSAGNKMVVKFKSGNYGWYRGFSAAVKFV